MSTGQNNVSRHKQKYFLYCLLFIGNFCVTLFFASPAAAANLSISPAVGNFTTQNNFTVSVEVNTSQAINGVEGVIQFPTDKIEVVGIDKSRSIMSLWVQEPTFSNGDGVVHFSAIKLNPGFIGQKGNVINIIFRVKAAGVANVRFASGAILANDGKGSNLLDFFGSAVYSLKQRPMTIPAPASGSQTESFSSSLPLPLIKIWTQDENGKDVLFNSSEGDPKWSNMPYAKLTWTLPAGITGVATLVDDSPDTDPTTKSSDLPDFQILPFLAEGRHYFHIRFINKYGGGPTLHLPLFIDLHEPDNFSIDFVDAEAQARGLFSTSNPKPRISFFTEDQLSGLDRYEIKIDNDNWKTAQIERNGVFILPKLELEKRHDVIVRALDLAGNSVDAATVIIVEPIISPSITYYLRNIDSSSGALIIEGKSAPQAKIELVLEKDHPIMVQDKADQDGNWRIVYSKILPAGTYNVRARQVLDNGAESLFSSTVIVRVDSLTGRLLAHLQNIDWYIWVIIFIIMQAGNIWYYRRNLNKFKMRANTSS